MSPPDLLLGFSGEAAGGVAAEAERCFREAGMEASLADGVLQLRLPASLLPATAEKMELELEVADRDGVFRAGQPYLRPFEAARAGDFARPGEFTVAQRQAAAAFFANRVEPTAALRRLLGGGERATADGGGVLFALDRAGMLEFRAAGHDPEARKRLLRACLARPFAEPLDELAAYYGSEVAMYFAWATFTASMLVIPAAAGVLLHLYGGAVDKSAYAPLYGVLVAVWATCYVKAWDRRAASLAYRWGVLGHDTRPEAAYVGVRPSFRGELRRSDVTGGTTRFYPAWRRGVAYAVSLAVTLAMLSVAVGVMILTHNAMGYMKSSVFHVPAVHQFSDPGRVFDPNSWLSLVPIVAHSVLIMALNGVYGHVAEHLTERENHKAKAAHEFSLLLKRFCFEALDCYLPLFYLALFQRDSNILRLELMALFTTDSARRIGTELVLPFVQRRFGGAKQQQQQQPEGEDVADKGDYEPFDDYLEMSIQFGYVTMFASAFPLASLLAVLATVVEVRSDATKIALVTRKPVPRAVSSIGLFTSVLKGQAFLSILTNAYIFGFASDQMVAWIPALYKHVDAHGPAVLEAGQVVAADTEVFRSGAARWAVAAVFGLEHAVGLLCAAIMLGVAAYPSWVRRRRARAALEDRHEVRTLRRVLSSPDERNEGTGDAGGARRRR